MHIYTVSTAAAALGISRQTASKAVNLLSLGTRLGDADNAPVMLSAADLPAIKAQLKKNEEKRSACKFHPDNDLWKRRKKYKKKASGKRNR